MTALVPNISKEILCRPTWVIQILLFKLIFPFLLGCYMAICHTFLTIALACWRDLVYLFWLYFTHIWQPIYNVLSFKHFIWYDLSFCHKPFRSWDVNLWFLFPFTHFFKIVLEIKGCSLFMSVAYTWVFTFLVGERFQSIYHCELSCKTNPIIITYLYQESKLIWRN